MSFDSWFLGEGLGPGFDLARADGLVLSPGRDQSPAQPCQVGCAIAHDGNDFLSRRDIVAWRSIQASGNAEFFGDGFDIDGKCIATAHVAFSSPTMPLTIPHSSLYSYSFLA